MKPAQTDFKGLDRSVRMQRIIDAASGLFHRKGFKAATLDEVARELHLTKAALYNYIPSKGKLLSIIYGQAFEKIFHRIYEISVSNASPEEKLRQIIRDHICNIITSDIAMFSVFFAEENQLPTKDFQKIRGEKKKYTRLVIQIIDEGIAQGVFKPVDSRLQAYAILGMCNWLYKWYKPQKEVFSPEEIADHFIALLEAGYLARPHAPAGHKKGESGVEKKTYKELKALSDRLASLVERYLRPR
ncbi:MAG: TetR/AcrR family transcriptional regulator [Deltaproteobacteria bacterium]|nr:TetR/AcrR family transcriptional regulator [Deltaproteobacteria bacterium]